MFEYAGYVTTAFSTMYCSDVKERESCLDLYTGQIMVSDHHNFD